MQLLPDDQLDQELLQAFRSEQREIARRRRNRRRGWLLLAAGLLAWWLW